MMSKNRVARLLIDPFQKFFELSAAGGILLFVAALCAFAWANSPWRETYFHLWHTSFIIGFGNFVLNKPLHFWINDGLMAVFFFLVGLEIKREVLVGELSSPRQAALPIIAAFGGMLVPGVIYSLLNPIGTSLFQGWGIPTVTDIAFAIGVLALLGPRVPLSLKVFLTALAIVDDIGAVIVIALFYSQGIHWDYLLLAILILSALVFLNRLGVRQLYAYIVLGLALWLATLFSGVHTTIAGVLLAFTIPAGSKISVDTFYEEGFLALKQLKHSSTDTDNYSILTEDDYQTGVQHIESLCEEAQAPLQRLEHFLHTWVNYAIMPLFALANAGLTLHIENLPQIALHPVTIGIVLGLVLGKQIGITLFTGLAVWFRFADLPEGITWKHIYGVSWLGGIGFTMSLFIANLAFKEEALIDAAKIGIFTASLIAGVTGGLILWKLLSSFATSTNHVSKAELPE